MDHLIDDSDRLMPCPFCGAEAEIITLAGETDEPSIGAQCVQCTSSACGAASDVLTEHIKVCERHPMRKAEADVAMLRAALVGLVGADSEQELRQMEATMRLLPAPDADKAVSINAIHALLATMPSNAKVSGRPHHETEKE